MVRFRAYFTRYYVRQKKSAKRFFASDFRICPPLVQLCRLRAPGILGDSNKALREKNQAFQLGNAIQLDDCSHLVIIEKNARYDAPFFRSVAERRGLAKASSWKSVGK